MQVQFPRMCLCCSRIVLYSRVHVSAILGGVASVGPISVNQSDEVIEAQKSTELLFIHAGHVMENRVAVLVL